jgi:hypothetical protein
MISVPVNARVLVATRPVDKGAHGLAAVASEVLGDVPSLVRLLFSARSGPIG